MRAEAFLDALLTLVHQVVEIRALLRPRLNGRIDIAHPGDLLFVLAGVGPLAQDVDAPLGAAPSHRRGIV